MIFIESNKKHKVLFPKNEKTCKVDYTLLIKSELTNQFWSYEVSDSDYLSNYYSFSVDFSNLKDGEYVYMIDNVASGLLRIGEIKYDHTDFENNENNDYIVYE